MGIEIWIVTLILVATLVLLITELVPLDLTALFIFCALMLTRVLTPEEAVAGFANPAVITIGSMFLISRALIRTGAVGFIAQRVIAYAKGNARLALLISMLLVGSTSAFINNTPVVVLFIPIIMSLSCEYDLSPSKLLIPVSYASILGGTCTLIGTSTNIIVSNLSNSYGYGKLSMFELSPLGVPIAILGIGFVFFAAPRLMPGHAVPACEIEDREDRRYLAELLLPPESTLIGLPSDSAFIDKYPNVAVFEVIRDSVIFYPHRYPVALAANDLILVKGSPNDLIGLLSEKDVVLPHADAEPGFGPGGQKSLIVELIVPPQSSLIGERLLESDLLRDPDLHIIAVKRRWIHYSEQKIQNLTLGIGDILLVRCSEEKLGEIRRRADFIIVEDVHHEIVHKVKARWALSIFAGIVIVATSGLADIMTCAIAGVLLMILTGCLQLRGAYQNMQGNILMLIAAAIALGSAMEKTGTAKIYANEFLRFFQGSGPGLVLAGTILFTSLSTELLSNNAAAVLLLPIAVSTATTLGVSPKPFILAVCFGASSCFATPIGYQTNLLVYGPGRYRFLDYLKMGIPVNLIVLIMGSIFIPKIWPF